MYGKLKIIIGPMFSGKTTWLNNELTKFTDTEFSVVKICHSDDIRFGQEIGSTHNSSYKSLTENLTIFSCKSISNLDITPFDVIGIDEGQFFDDLVPTVKHWVTIYKKYVIITGLDGDFNRNKFGHILDLIPFCDDVKKLRATCVRCLKDYKQNKKYGNIKAIFSKKIVHTTEQKLIGGKESYMAVCRYHYDNDIP